MARKKHKTPPELDFLFDRDFIDEEDYKEFWPRWWKANELQRNNIINEYQEKVSQLEIFSKEDHFPTKGIVYTASKFTSVAEARAKAESEAKHIGGFVVRRNKNGRFSRNGSKFQAIRRRKRK